MINRLLSALPYSSARKIARFCGTIISTHFVLGNIVRLKTRRLYDIIAQQVNWDATLSLQNYSDAIREIIFWRDNFHTYNEKSVRVCYNPSLKGFSDASSTGLVGHIFIDGRDKTAYKNFNLLEKQKSSTWRELQAINFSINSLQQFLCHRSLHWHTDNFAASLIAKSGSNKADLQKLSEEIFGNCRAHNIDLKVFWVPRDSISYTDFLSKQQDYDDWQTTKFFFDLLNHKWGPFTVDRFADNENAKVARFNSKFYCPSSEAVDAFSCSWAGENNYLVPPVHLIPKVLQHMEFYRATGVLVVPYWTSAVFWPLVLEAPSVLRSFIKEALFIANPRGYLQQGKCSECVIGSDSFTSPVLAFLISFANHC